jgi:hypothetical protein
VVQDLKEKKDMADFHKAYKISMGNAGGYVFDPNDLGGETYRDISRKFNPQWSGWALVDATKKSHGGSLPKNYTDATLDASAEAFYKVQFWDVMYGDKIKTQEIANIIFDNELAGPGRARDMAEKILNDVYKKSFALDGKFQPETIDAINSVPQKTFFELYKQYRIAFFKFSAGALPKDHSLYNFFYGYNKASEASKAQRNTMYLNGWLNRVNKYTSDLISDIIDTASKNKGPIITILFFLVAGTVIAVTENPIKAKIKQLFNRA